MGRLLPALYAVSFLLIPTLCLPCVYADDASSGVMLPGLRSDPVGSVTVATASLVLRSGHIEATLTVTVQPGQRGSVTVQMPRFGWLGESEPYPDRQFSELQILDGGTPATMESSFAAFVGSVDVTEAIRKAEVDPFAIADTPPFIAPKAGRAPSFEALERLGAVEKSGGDYLAKWTVQRKVRVELNPGSHALTFTYKARPGYALIRYDLLTRPTYLAKYCLSPHDLATVFGQTAATQMFAVSNYAIPLSIDGRPPSALSVAVETPGKEGAPPSLIAFCGADGKAVVGQPTNVRAAARTDAKGIIHILAIETAKGSR